MNFFLAKCQEPPIADALFGLCDNQEGSKAYSNITDPSKWIAVVKNSSNKTCIFTAIDKCVINDDEEIGRGRCDGMLTTEDQIFFVELKDIRQSWIKDAIKQLESTVQFFLANHDISVYRHKKAVACNKKGRFQVIDNELNLRFFRTYGIRLDVQADIIIV
jgi:hypothetical protein